MFDIRYKTDICECGIEDFLVTYFDEISFLPTNELYSILQNNHNRCYVGLIDDWTDDYGENYINEGLAELESIGNKWLVNHNLNKEFKLIFDGYRGTYITKIKE